MKLTRTWIDTQLNHSQRTQLVDWLIERAGANPTGEQIRTAIFELFPDLDPPSVQSCIGWKNKSWVLEINRRRLRETSEAAGILADASGSDLDEANRRMLQAVLFDELMAVRQGARPYASGESAVVFGGEEGIAPAEQHADIDNLVLAVARMGKLKQSGAKLEADLKLREEQVAKLQRERVEWEEQRRAVAEQVDRINKAPAANVDEVRAAAVAEIDRIMGLTK